MVAQLPNHLSYRIIDVFLDDMMAWSGWRGKEKIRFFFLLIHQKKRHKNTIHPKLCQNVPDWKLASNNKNKLNLEIKNGVMFLSSGFQRCHVFLLFRWSVEIFLGQLSKPTFEPIGKGADEKSSAYACDDTTIGHHTTSETRAEEFFKTNASDLFHAIFLRCECIRCWKVHYIFSQNGGQVLMILFSWCWKNPYAWKVSKTYSPDNKEDSGKTTIWRCISIWKKVFFLVPC